MLRNLWNGKNPSNNYEKAVLDNSIDEFGICIDTYECKKIKYLIVGRYAGGEVPEGMVLYEFPKGEWAVFECYGPCPEKLQELTNKIFKEWLPLNNEYELRGDANVEWYDKTTPDLRSENYHTQIWLPLRKIK